MTIDMSSEVVEEVAWSEHLIWRLERFDTGEWQLDRKTGRWVPVYSIVRRTLVNRATGEIVDDAWRDPEGRTRSCSNAIAAECLVA